MLLSSLMMYLPYDSNHDLPPLTEMSPQGERYDEEPAETDSYFEILNRYETEPEEISQLLSNIRDLLKYQSREAMTEADVCDLFKTYLQILTNKDLELDFHRASLFDGRVSAAIMMWNFIWQVISVDHAAALSEIPPEVLESGVMQAERDLFPADPSVLTYEQSEEVFAEQELLLKLLTKFYKLQGKRFAGAVGRVG